MAIGNYAAWSAEYTPSALHAVGQAVVDRFAGIDWSHIGFKGDDAHPGGYHRSLRWCRVTRGRGVDYSDRISRDTSQIGAPPENAIRAIDIVAPPEILIPMCSRVDWAMRHGLLDDLREWYGNDDGDNRVDGYDNFFDVVVSSDSSHLWHLHGSLYTDTVENSHDRFIAVLLGTPGWNNLEDDMGTLEGAQAEQLENSFKILEAIRDGSLKVRQNVGAGKYKDDIDNALSAAIADLQNRAGTPPSVTMTVADRAAIADQVKAGILADLAPLVDLARRIGNG